MPWEPEDELILRDMWKENATGQEIAYALQMTRSQVLGKAWRLGLTKKPKRLIPVYGKIRVKNGKAKE